MSVPAIVVTADLDAYLSGDPQAALDRATATVRAYCGWHVAPQATTSVVVDAPDSTVLLPSLHVTDVASVTVDGEPVPVGDVVWGEDGVLKLNRCSRRGRVEVTFTHGYDVVPNVAGVILALAAREKENPTGVARAQVGQVSETYSQAAHNQTAGGSLLATERASLAPYKLPTRP